MNQTDIAALHALCRDRKWVAVDDILHTIKTNSEAPMRQIIRTVEELEVLPVGSVVMTLWDNGPLHYVMQKYSDGWYGWPSESPLYPLGARTTPRAVLVLWNPDIDTEPQ